MPASPHCLLKASLRGYQCLSETPAQARRPMPAVTQSFRDLCIMRLSCVSERCSTPGQNPRAIQPLGRNRCAHLSSHDFPTAFSASLQQWRTDHIETMKSIGPLALGGRYGGERQQPLPRCCLVRTMSRRALECQLHADRALSAAARGPSLCRVEGVPMG